MEYADTRSGPPASRGSEGHRVEEALRVHDSWTPTLKSVPLDTLFLSIPFTCLGYPGMGFYARNRRPKTPHQKRSLEDFWTRRVQPHLRSTAPDTLPQRSWNAMPAALGTFTLTHEFSLASLPKKRKFVSRRPPRTGNPATPSEAPDTVQDRQNPRKPKTPQSAPGYSFAGLARWSSVEGFCLHS